MPRAPDSPWKSRIFPWDDDNEEVVKTLWAEGNSAGTIARVLFGRTGLPVSRNAVLGKLHRLGLLRKPTKERKEATNRAISRQATLARKRIAPPERITKPTQPSFPPVDQRTFPWRVKLMERASSQCPYPVPGSPADADMLVCGDRVEDGGTYCSACCAVVYSTRAVMPIEKLVPLKVAAA